MKDKITRTKAGRIIIQCRGEKKSLIEWAEDPRVTISERQLRRRTREVEQGNMNMTIDEMLFFPIKRSGCNAKVIKPETPPPPPSEAELWQRQCMAVLTTKRMTL